MFEWRLIGGCVLIYRITYGSHLFPLFFVLQYLLKFFYIPDAFEGVIWEGSNCWEFSCSFALFFKPPAQELDEEITGA